MPKPALISYKDVIRFYISKLCLQLIDLISPYMVRAEYASWFTLVGAGGHAVWTLVSATCSLHLALSLLGDACVMRSGSRHTFRLTLAQESGHL